MHFYQLSRLYTVSFRHRGQYARLQALLGFDDDHVWTDSERLSFSAGFSHFRQAFDKLNTERLDVTAAEALLVWLQVYPFAEIKEHTQPELGKTITAIWSDIRRSPRRSPSRSARSRRSTTRASLSKLISAAHPEHLNVAFIYAFDPQHSAWTRARARARVS